MIKRLTITLILAAAFTWSFGQTYTFKPNGDPGSNTLEIFALGAELIVEGHSGTDIKITAKDFDGTIPEKAKGLKPLSQFGEDNTEVGLYMKQEGSTIKLSGASKKSNDAIYTIKIPQNMGLSVDYSNWNSEDLLVLNLSGEINIQSKVGDVELRNITGPVVLNTLSSDIEASFSSISSKGPTSISSTSGDIDLTIPSSSKADFDLKSISGEIYTNIEFQLSDEDKNGLKKMMGGTSVNASLNGGGVSFEVNAISGDVFIRKAE